ncbi:MAG: hypothetical protein ACUVX8_17775, partial [Candidatus Zipacnadales bacterium]
LNDAEGRLLSIGILQDFDGINGKLACLCRPEAAAAEEVRFGRLQLAPDGTHSVAFEDYAAL